MYTLVVVDMQPKFPAAAGGRVVNNCLREITQAITDNAPIIFLEFSGYEHTHPRLTAPVRGYNGSEYGNYFTLVKSIDDGSPEVQQLVFDKKLPTNFKVCGVNTDCCVHATVRGLMARFPKASIEVIADACDSDWNHMGGITAMQKIGGLVNVRYER